MAYLIDTSILARLANATDAQYSIADRAVLELHRRGEVLHIPRTSLDWPDLGRVLLWSIP